VARLALLALVVLSLAACSSSKQEATRSSTSSQPIKSPIVVKVPLAQTQWRSPITVSGTSTLSGTLKVEVLDLAGKRLGSKDTTASDGRFSVKVPFATKKLVPGSVSVRDESGEHTVLISVVLTP
jgi:starvation-inducible outer membrane lipoprotein